MKIKWKILMITSLVCLSPILLGVALWNQLPNEIAIHFDINNRPDNFASKPFAVFGLPVLMVLLQIFCCVINDVNAKKYGERKKFSLITKWIVPAMTVILQCLTLGYALNIPFDIRRWAMGIVAAVMIVIGNYLPKFDSISGLPRHSTRQATAQDVVISVADCTTTEIRNGTHHLRGGGHLDKCYIKNKKDVEKEKARKINRTLGFMTVILGLLALVTLFLPPIASVAWLFLLIPYTIISVVYTAVKIKE